MELINFLFIIFSVYMFITTSILTKLFFVFVTSLSLSFYRERENLKDSNNILLLTIYYLISFVSYCFNCCLNLYEIGKDYKIVLFLRDGVEYLNYMFVSGRNDLFYHISNKVSNVFVPPKKRKIKKLENKKKVFDNDDDMMDFLEDLDSKKDN